MKSDALLDKDFLKRLDEWNQKEIFDLLRPEEETDDSKEADKATKDDDKELEL